MQKKPEVRNDFLTEGWIKFREPKEKHATFMVNAVRYVTFKDNIDVVKDLKDGSKVRVTGYYKNEKWTNKEGKEVWTIKFYAQDINKLAEPEEPSFTDEQIAESERLPF